MLGVPARCLLTHLVHVIPYGILYKLEAAKRLVQLWIRTTYLLHGLPRVWSKCRGAGRYRLRT